MADTANIRANIRPLVAGNWKMNGLRASLGEADSLLAFLAGGRDPGCDVMLCPPATLLSMFADRLGDGPLLLGGQDCHTDEKGARTGDISARMLADIGCRAVIVGHSERRSDHGESDALVHRKAQAVHDAGLIAIICIGETEAERDRGETLDVLGRQLDGSVPADAGAGNSVVAYEPVWAIGSGRTPSLGEVAEAHGFIRDRLAARLGAEGARMRLLYGGSVKASNADELMAIENVDGALVGGASLKAADFWGIIETYRGDR